MGKHILYQGGARMNKTELIKQTYLAFDFLTKLFHESSYLIKEIEGLLGKEPEEFKIGKPSGYGITAKSSTGLDRAEDWIINKCAVFFCPKEMLKPDKGQTVTDIIDGLKIFYIRIVFHEKGIQEPYMLFGTINNIKIHSDKGRLKKFENIMGYIEYNERKVFKDYPIINYTDTSISFSAKLNKIKLFDINGPDEIEQKILIPGLEEFRKIQNS